MRNIRIIHFLLLALCLGTAKAAEDGIVVERDTAVSVLDRQRLARTIYRHNFENIRDPDTGVLQPDSASLNPDGWPDFWEPVRAVGFPEYLIPTVRIVPDTSRTIPGAYRDEDNHVLMMEFDGTRVGVRTRTPVPIDPALAYEYSVLTRDNGLQGARIRTGVQWMRIDPAASSVLRTDEIPNLGTGQSDWPVRSARMLVNDPPVTSNAARLFVVLDRDPQSIGGAYHGTLWLDDIILKPLPKILVEAPRVAQSGDRQVIPVRYSGLFDNVPDPDNPGYFKGKRYSRRVEVRDIFNQPIRIGLPERRAVDADDGGLAVEEVPFPRDRHGVYYFNIRLYDVDGNLAVDVMRAVAVMRPAPAVDGLALRSGKPVYGVSAGAVPSRVLTKAGYLRSILTWPGLRMTKVIPWPDSYARPGGNEAYYTSLASEVRNLRSGGIGATGVIRAPRAMFGTETLADAVDNQAEQLRNIIDEAGRHLGLFVDGWQWGDDNDDSLRHLPPGQNREMLAATLREIAGSLPQTQNVRLGPQGIGELPVGRPEIVEAFFPENQPADRLWASAVSVFPWLFEPYFKERGSIYPPRRLSILAPAPAGDRLEEQARESRRAGSWISLESARAYPHEPNAAAERVQLEQFLIRAIYATVLSPDMVFLGELFDPERGLLRRDALGTGTLETAARPTYLAAATLVEQLEGTEYLGQIGLLPPFEAHVFRRPGTDVAVIAVWHTDSEDIRPLRRVEIANGPPMQLVDWAGNTEQLPANIPVRRVPSFITGMTASLALTRMSVRVAPEPRVMAQNRRQNQMLEIVNHMSRQAPVLFRLRYAAQPDGTMENGWAVSPEEMRINLAPATTNFAPGLLRYSVTPDPNSSVQFASPGFVDKAGSKITQISMSVNTSPPADMLLYLPFRLQSDLDVDIEALPRVDDPNFVTLQLKLRWYPSEPARRRGEIKLLPYFVKRGQMRESAAFPIAVKAMAAENRGKPEAPFESAELRIPRQPLVQTWIGLTEDGGSNFYLVDVTDFLTMP